METIRVANYPASISAQEVIMTGMTGKERIKMVFAHKSPDRVPIAEQLIVSRVAGELLGRYAYTGGGEYARNEIEMLQHGERDFLVAKHVQDVIDLYHYRLDLDAIPVELVPPKNERACGIIKLDLFTYRYEDVYGRGTFEIKQFNPDSGEFFTIDSSIRQKGLEIIKNWVKELEKGIGRTIQFDPGQFDMIDVIKAKVGQTKAIFAQHAMAIPINEAWLEALVVQPSLIATYLDYQVHWSRAYIEALVEHGVDFILGGGDLATNHGPVYSPKQFKEIVAPRFRAIVDYCHHLGIPYIFRSDGDTRQLWEYFKEIGVDGLAEIDAQAGMDMGEMRKYFGKDFVLFGNVDCARTLVSGTKEEIFKEVKACIEKAGLDGGLILSSSNSIHWNVPAQNYLYMIEAARKYGEYPAGKAEREERVSAVYEENKTEIEASVQQLPQGVQPFISVSAEELKRKKEKTLEQRMIDIFLAGTITTFATGGFLGYVFKLHSIEWILKCLAVELMLLVGTAVSGTIIWAIFTPEKRFNSFSLLGLAFYLFFWIFYLSWDLQFFRWVSKAMSGFLYSGWLISSIASFAFTSIGEIIARERKEEGLGPWAVSIIFWFLIFYFLFYATG